jgi:hypothetical protein
VAQRRGPDYWLLQIGARHLEGHADGAGVTGRAQSLLAARSSLPIT